MREDIAVGEGPHISRMCEGGRNQAKVRDRVVFVVDDEPIIAQTLATILNQAGFAAFAFDHPDKALSAAATTPPDLPLSDVAMSSEIAD